MVEHIFGKDEIRVQFPLAAPKNMSFIIQFRGIPLMAKERTPKPRLGVQISHPPPPKAPNYGGFFQYKESVEVLCSSI